MGALPASIGVLLAAGVVGLPLALYLGSRAPEPRREPESAADEAGARFDRLLTHAEATAASCCARPSATPAGGRSKVTVIRETRAVDHAR
jgi:hypothetical protein